jgi:hypothetical protein
LKITAAKSFKTFDPDGKNVSIFYYQNESRIKKEEAGNNN